MTNRQIWPDDIQPIEEFHFEHIERPYIKVIIIRITLIYLVLMAVALFIPEFVSGHAIAILIATETVLAVAFAINVSMMRKIYSFKGYALRDKDISYRSGILFESVTTIPFSKIQQVSIRMNPVSRIFKLYYLDVINGSQDSMNSVTIPGLSHEKAERLKSLLINKADLSND